LISPLAMVVRRLEGRRRDGRDPLDLLDEIERVLGIPASPATWPIGVGRGFQGVYDRWTQRVLLFERGDGAAYRAVMQVSSFDDPAFRAAVGAASHARLCDPLAVLQGAGTGFDPNAFRAGELTPVFFGSALTNFGVEPFLDQFIELAPPPRGLGGEFPHAFAQIELRGVLRRSPPRAEVSLTLGERDLVV
jgi:peptide chain release factor 3